MNRIDAANEVLATFCDSVIEQRRGGIYVSWKCHKGWYTRKWMCRGQDFYPVWHKKWNGGGTASTALSQLIRWVQNKPVLPLATWEYWSGERVKLVSTAAVETLRAAGYPVDVPCVLCHNTIRGSLDWWNLGKVSGPCCGWTSGCRQKIQ